MDIGKQTALRWIDERSARTVQPIKIDMPSGCGVCARSGNLSTWQGFDVTRGERLAYERTLVWDGNVKLRADLFAPGFGFLDRWQVAAPLWSYDELAANIGTDADRDTTKAVIHDLRVPVYDTRLLFMRRCATTEKLLELWQQERIVGDERLAFMRALYAVKPLVLALPMTWTNK